MDINYNFLLQLFENKNALEFTQTNMFCSLFGGKLFFAGFLLGLSVASARNLATLIQNQVRFFFLRSADRVPSSVSVSISVELRR